MTTNTKELPAALHVVRTALGFTPEEFATMLALPVDVIDRAERSAA